MVNLTSLSTTPVGAYSSFPITTTLPPVYAWQAPQTISDIESFGLLYHINLFLFGILGLIFLFRLPRLLARCWSMSELTDTLFLHHHSLGTHRRVQFNSEKGPTHRDLSTDNSHNRSPRSYQRVDDKGRPIVPSYPPHVSSCPKLLRPLLRMLRRRIAPGISIGKVLVMGLYFAIMLYPGFYQVNPFADPDRYGWIAVSQYPLALALAAKNSVLGSVLGVGYEKLNFMHRFIGKTIVLAANIHCLGYFYSWTLLGIFSQAIKAPTAYWGLIALICLDLLYFFSTSFWRQNAYNMFISTHVVCAILLLPATLMHKPVMAPYIYAALGLLLLDYLLRIVRTRYNITAIIRPLPEFGVTHIEIPKLNAGWRAGQHVRLRVVTSGMGALGWTEIHPFTIASVPDGPEGVVLMCKKAGDWTERLYDFAKSGGQRGRGEFEGREVKVWIEGPYGGPGPIIFSSFSAAVFIAGGSGITFALSSVQDLVRKDLEATSRVKIIELVWVVQDASSLVPLLPILTSMIQQSLFTPLRISIFYTKAPTGKFPFSEDFFRSTSLTLSPGRPKISKIIEGTINKAVSLGSGGERYKDQGRISGLAIGICGPTEMVDGVYEEVGKVDPLRRHQVGGVEVHEETFGW
ncbi:putative iron reductase [Moniliophthora roreri MCA 2997]|uniref:ferric-chelate reductase (NADPH) n=2 Tax=Moniliophthora roreri TaxID=221103 RepID=V2WG08_MONRO|nr:putative iron reductase [Moniliophthora roreri MCA 2997]KAI3616553.1 putative iron reductase [Moniliophthora roreri]